jgi:hypothetical protein
MSLPTIRRALYQKNSLNFFLIGLVPIDDDEQLQLQSSPSNLTTLFNMV